MGNRQFETGAKRDKNDNKGRMDLIPWEVVSQLSIEGWQVYDLLSKFMETGDTIHLYDILNEHMTHQDLIPLSKIYQNGASKYGENNWKMGIPIHSFIDSAIRHYVKHLCNITDEPHFHMFLWNIIGLIWEVENNLVWEDENHEG